MNYKDIQNQKANEEMEKQFQEASEKITVIFNNLEKDPEARKRLKEIRQENARRESLNQWAGYLSLSLALVGVWFLVPTVLHTDVLMSLGVFLAWLILGKLLMG